MRKTATATAVWTVCVANFTPALAQSANSPPARATLETQQLYDSSQFRAPVGHRQPRPAEIKPPEQAAADPMEELERENAMLARRIGGICRGC